MAYIEDEATDKTTKTKESDSSFKGKDSRKRVRKAYERNSKAALTDYLLA